MHWKSEGIGRSSVIVNHVVNSYADCFCRIRRARDVLLALFIIVASAKLMAEIFERLRQPAVVGEILAGVLIGPSVLGWVQPTETDRDPR